MIKKYSIWLLFIFIVILNGCSFLNEKNESNKKHNKPSVSEKFQFDDLIMDGKKDRIGYVKLNGDPEKLFVSQEGALYLWRFFGNENDFQGELKLKGISKSNNKEILLASSKDIVVETFGGNQKGIEKHLKVSFPTSGIWELRVYFGKIFFDSVFVEVSESNQK